MIFLMFSLQFQPLGEEFFQVIELLAASTSVLLRSLPQENDLVSAITNTLISLSKCGPKFSLQPVRTYFTYHL